MGGREEGEGSQGNGGGKRKKAAGEWGREEGEMISTERGGEKCSS